MPNICYSIKLNDFLTLGESCNVYWTDRENRILGFNETQFQLTTQISNIVTKEELIGKHISEVLSGESCNIVINENKLVMDTGCSHQFFNIFMPKNHQSRLYVTIKTPVYDEENNIVGVFGISQCLSVYSENKPSTDLITNREFECLCLLMKGKTAKEMAQILHLSNRSIEAYIASIKSKLDCKTKFDLINKVNELGLSTLMLRSNASSEPYYPGNFTPK